MLVPVSPSGTGKTFKALIAEAFFSSQRVATQNISLSSRPVQRDLGFFWLLTVVVIFTALPLLLIMGFE
jgi:hypothetical protein